MHLANLVASLRPQGSASARLGAWQRGAQHMQGRIRKGDLALWGTLNYGDESRAMADGDGGLGGKVVGPARVRCRKCGAAHHVPTRTETSGRQCLHGLACFTRVHFHPWTFSAMDLGNFAGPCMHSTPFGPPRRGTMATCCSSRSRSRRRMSLQPSSATATGSKCAAHLRVLCALCSAFLSQRASRATGFR